MKLLFLLVLLVLMPLGRALADEGTNSPSASAQRGIFVVNINQGPEGTAMLLSGLDSCTLQETKFLCGQYADESWLTGKTIYLNPAHINSVYAFASSDEYKAAVNKYKAGSSTGIIDSILGK